MFVALDAGSNHGGGWGGGWNGDGGPGPHPTPAEREYLWCLRRLAMIPLKPDNRV